MRFVPLAALLAASACVLVACESPPAPVAIVEKPAPVVAEEAPAPAAAPARQYPFDPSPEDRASIDAHGFAGTARAREASGFDLGLRVVGILPHGCLKAAGLEERDLIVEFAGVTFSSEDADPIGKFRDKLRELGFEQPATLTYVRGKQEPVQVDIVLGRRPPAFNGLEAPDFHFAAPLTDPALDALIKRAVALDEGELRFADTRKRNRERMAKTDAFRLRQTVQAHMHLASNEGMARSLTDAVAGDSGAAIGFASSTFSTLCASPWGIDVTTASLDVLVDLLQKDLEQAAASLCDTAEENRAHTAFGRLSAEERAYVLANLASLTDSLSEGPYLHYDSDLDRERHNRRIVALLGRVNRDVLEHCTRLLLAEVSTLAPHLQRAARDAADARASEKDRGLGLLLERNTAAGRIEIWGAGDQRHTKRCAFRMDLGGNDTYLDVGGRADFDHPVSINVDVWGDDIYGATSPGCQGAAIGGIGVLIDVEGDDQYVARHWSQGCAIAGFGLLEDLDGNDVYRSIDLCQGVGLVGAGVLSDHAGDDHYTAQMYAQGVGMAAGVGALVDHDGNDRYACTGRNQSGYGEDGLFEGWGQGCAFGFRHVTSGGIAMLYDRAGDDVYEAGNFSQGGGYHYAWGILRDDSGNDRYIGSRYAQGFAAHQAQATFLEGDGDDLYQSHSSVAQGLSWDETSVFFRDYAGDDRYETSGFSLASAAHNGMVVFIDDAGRDSYRAVPGKASSNGYHGGFSFALFVDAGGEDDRYGTGPGGGAAWNDRVAWRHQGAYFIDCDDPAQPLRALIRNVESDE